MSKIVKSVRISGEHYTGALMIHDDGCITVSVKSTPGREREVQEYLVNELMNGIASYIDRTVP